MVRAEQFKLAGPERGRCDGPKRCGPNQSSPSSTEDHVIPIDPKWSEKGGPMDPRGGPVGFPKERCPNRTIGGSGHITPHFI